jgi:hypothetical protein
MLFGDPYKMAFLIEKVPEWSNDSFANGLCFVIIDGKLFSDVNRAGDIPNSTLNVDIQSFIGIWPSSPALVTPLNDIQLFEADKKIAFLFMYKKYSGINIEEYTWNFNELNDDVFVDNFYGYNAAPVILTDNDCYVFAVSNGNFVRILAGKIAYDAGQEIFDFLDVKEIILTKQYVNELVLKVKDYAINDLGFTCLKS